MGNRLAQVRRERGWKKTRLMRELRAAAARRHEVLPQDPSLSRRIAVWENQDGAVGDFYRELLCEVYGEPAAELGLVDAPDMPSLAAPTIELEERPSFARLDAGLVTLLKDHTQSLRLLDRRLGAATLLAQTSAHVKQIEELLCYALPNVHRSATAAALGEVASLAGWQALDIGQLGQAWRHYETAKAGAREGGDPAVLGYVTAEQAYVLLDAGHAAEALQMVQYARDREPRRLPPVLRAWLLAAEGEVCAALGDRSGALRALDGAAKSLPSQPADPDLPFLMLNVTHLARWRGHCLARLGEGAAIDDLTAALDAMGEGRYGRAEAGLRVDLALAYRVRGDIRSAQQHAQRAADLAGRTGSARQRRRIERLLAA